MRVEVPMFKKCCFCIPLRYGLLIWGYLKLIIAATYAMLLSFVGISQKINDVKFSIIIWMAVVLCLVDISFSIVFIVGAHKKDYKLLRVFYRFTLTILIIYVTLVGIVVSIQIYKVATLTEDNSYMYQYVVHNIVQQCVISFLNIALQVYLLFLTRSEVLKLKANCQFQFVNNAADPHCQMKNTSDNV